MHAAGNGSAHHKSECPRWNCSILRRNGAVGEIDFGGVIADGAAVQEVPGDAVGINCPAAEDASVEEEEAAVARPGDLGIELGHQHGLAMVNGDLRRTDLYFERHCSLSCASSRMRARNRSSPSRTPRASPRWRGYGASGRGGQHELRGTKPDRAKHE